MADERERARARACAAAGHHEWVSARGPCELCAVTRCEVGDHNWPGSLTITAPGADPKPQPLGHEPRCAWRPCLECGVIEKRWGPWDTWEDQRERARQAERRRLQQWTTLIRNYGKNVNRG